MSVVLGPLFNGGDQFHRYIECACAAPLLEGQVPARLGATGPFEGREAAFDKRAKPGDLMKSGLAQVGVPIRNNRAGIHRVGVSRGTGGRHQSSSPGGFFEGLAEQLVDLLFQGAVIGDAPAALAGLFGGEGFGGAFSLEESGPAVIRAVELGQFGFAGAVGFAAGAAGGGEAAGEQREGDLEGDLF